MSVTQIEAVEAELKAAGVPLRYRPLDTFKRFYGSLADGPERVKLFDPINAWYLGKYGNAVAWDGVVARFPILVKGVVYLAQSRFIERGEVVVDFQETIEGLPPDIVVALSMEEKRLILEKLALSNRSFRSIYNLNLADDYLGGAERELVMSALYDLENVAVTLKHTGDTQTAVVQSYEAVEKYLKAALAKAGCVKDLKSFSHNIPKIFGELLRLEPRYSFLEKPIRNIQSLSPSMELRYSTVPRSVESAVEGYNGALYVCGAVAQMWLFDRERGATKPVFRECSFYVDGSNTTYYCKRVADGSASLILFQSSEIFGSQIATMKLDTDLSALYLEVTDPSVILSCVSN